LGACANASLELTTAAPIETSMIANRLRTSNGLSLIFPILKQRFEIHEASSRAAKTTPRHSSFHT